MKYCLLTTDHLENGVLFRDEEDFNAGMNFVAIQAHQSGIGVLAFILMSNHTHFVLRANRDIAFDFINRFKKRYSMYLRKKYGIKEFLRRNDIDIKEIPTEDEALERAIAYVQMNSVAANICTHPGQYPWGSGNLFFNPTRSAGKRLDELSGRQRERLLHSSTDTLPGHWLIGEEGYILPRAFVDIPAVEACYRTPKRMNFFLSNSSKARKRLEAAEDKLPAFRDQSILMAIPDLCYSLFQKYSHLELTPEELGELLRQLRFRFSSNVNQLARVCGLSYSETVSLLDNV